MGREEVIVILFANIYSDTCFFLFDISYICKKEKTLSKIRKMSKKFTDQLPKIGIVISVLLLIAGLWLDRMKLVSAGAVFMLCNLGTICGGYLAKQKKD